MRFLARLIAWLLAIAALYLAAIHAADPRGEFGTGWFPRAIENARVSKLALFDAYSADAPVQGLVLGSSRSMLLSPTVLEERTKLRFFNFAVNDGGVEDLLALYRWAKHRGAPLRQLVVGVDAYALFEAPMNDDLRRSEPLMRAYLDYPAAFPSLPERADMVQSLYGAVFSLPYLEAAAYSVALGIAPGHLPPATYEDRDGLLHDAKLERQLAAGTFRLSDTLDASTVTMRGYFTRVGVNSPQKRRDLETLVAEARAAGVHVVLWITCLHPVIVGRLLADTPYASMLDQTRAELEHLHQNYDADVYDFSTPDRFYGLPDGFVDGGHVDTENARRIVHALTEGRARGL
jgi:hypothetical protein